MLRRDHWSYDEMDFVYIIDIYWEIKEFIGTWVHIFFIITDFMKTPGLNNSLKSASHLPKKWFYWFQ